MNVYGRRNASRTTEKEELLGWELGVIKDVQSLSLRVPQSALRIPAPCGVDSFVCRRDRHCKKAAHSTRKRSASWGQKSVC